MTLDRAAVAAMLTSAAKLLADNADRLSEIDSRFGDGDHGVTINKIAKLLLERVPQWGDESIQDFLDDLGTAIMEVKGGSAGPLYGTMIGGLGVELGPDENELDADGVKRMFAGCLSEMEDIITAFYNDDIQVFTPRRRRVLPGTSCWPPLPPPRTAPWPVSSSYPNSAVPAATRSRPSARPTRVPYLPPCLFAV